MPLFVTDAIRPAGTAAYNRDLNLPDRTGKPLRWHEDALCAQTDPEIFFPEKGGSVVEAKMICGRCPVTNECLMEALRRRDNYGILGGLSARERRQYARENGFYDLPDPDDPDDPTR